MNPLRSSAAAACLVLLSACGGGETKAAGGPGAPKGPAPAPVAVRVATVGTADLPRTLRAVGSTRAKDEITVAAIVPGRVIKVFREVGERVAPGDPLVDVDDADPLLERDQRRRAVSESLAKLGLDAPPSGAFDVGAVPSVQRARLAADNARARYERSRALHERPKPLVSDQEVEDHRTALDLAQSDLRIAELNARAILAEVRTRQAALDTAEKRVRDVHHVVPEGARPGGAAPRGYVVAERFVAAGDYVRVGDPMHRLVDLDPLEVRVSIPERRMEEVAAGTPVRVTLAAAPVAGRVVRVRPEVDPATRTVEVDVDVPNPDLRLAPGAFATVEIEVGLDRGVPVVPASAIRSFAGVRKLVVVADGKAVERVVTLGRTVGDRVEIASGAKPGDVYVPAPPATLASGAPVTAEAGAPPDAAPAAAPAPPKDGRAETR